MLRKHAKPSPDFPLSAHPQGYFSKKILGKTHYFGERWGDPYEALRDYEAKRAYLEAGEEPPTDARVPLLECLDRFLDAKRRKVGLGELTERSWSDYKIQCDVILGVIAGCRPVASLRPSDFTRLRDHFKGAPTTITNNVTRSQVAFHWIEKHLNIKFNFGENFKKPSRQVMRAHRNKQPKKLFTPAELKLLIDSAPPQLKAMILLGLNCGLGNTDCATLRIESIDGNFHTHARPKTAVERRAHLWPITVESLKAVIGDRTTGLVFITRYKRAWTTGNTGSPISGEFRKLSREHGITRTFYDLRRTFQTIADGALDPVATSHCMGHADNSMAAVYRQSVSDDRLIKVANFVLTWSKLCEIADVS